MRLQQATVDTEERSSNHKLSFSAASQRNTEQHSSVGCPHYVSTEMIFLNKSVSSKSK
jgi:hypothetical protein